jgi:hypothetical protein
MPTGFQNQSDADARYGLVNHHRLSTLRDLAQHVSARGKHDWALIDVHDIETFLAAQPNNRPRRGSVSIRWFRPHRLAVRVLGREDLVGVGVPHLP